MLKCLKPPPPHLSLGGVAGLLPQQQRGQRPVHLRQVCVADQQALQDVEAWTGGADALVGRGLGPQVVWGPGHNRLLQFKADEDGVRWRARLRRGQVDLKHIYIVRHNRQKGTVPGDSTS
jgi:hypothetical protein